MRIGVVNYVNARPLARGLERDRASGRFELRYLPPAAIADGLAGGSLDVGLVPSIELVRQETWRGNARAALGLLDGYRERFGETVDWRIERARALATGGRPRAAADLLAPLVDERPEDYEARLVLALAESDAQRSTAAVASSKALAGLDVANPRTAEVQAYVSTPLRSAVRPRMKSTKRPSGVTVGVATAVSGSGATIWTVLAAEICRRERLRGQPCVSVPA